MCGIFSYLGNRKDAGALILDGLKALEYRGYDSWGIAVKKNDGNLFTEKHVGKIGNATLPHFSASVGIGHTRWATHGGVTKENSHPHADCKKEIVVVHNGIVENYAKLKQKLKLKHTFLSETDTEVVAHYLEEKLTKNTDLLDVVIKTFQELEGLSAIIVYRPATDEFVAVKNGSPLIFGIGDNEYYLASDSAALLPHTQKVYYLEDNEFLHLTQTTYTLYDFQKNKKEIKPIKLTFSPDSITLGNYPNYMMKEMHEQPHVIRSLVLEQKGQIQKAASLIKKAYGTYFIACGTAYYAALAGTYLFSKVAKRHTNASVGSEFE
ncbi:MAG TPA: class II glutamine amidotransferase [Candidatus Levybacteria bacterium]|nr:class II glutamine amidotransferase [Candidatus Levybacteria bacterium]